MRKTWDNKATRLISKHQPGRFAEKEPLGKGNIAGNRKAMKGIRSRIVPKSAGKDG